MPPIFSAVAQLWRPHASSPWATIVIIVTFGLGMGVNATLFSVLDALWLRAVPYPNAEQLVLLFRQSSGAGGRQVATVADVQRWKERSAFAFSHFSAYTNNQNAVLEVSNHTAIAGTKSVEATFFDTLGETPIVGRLFETADEIVVSEKLWRARLAATPAPSTLPVRLNGKNAVIVGVVSDRVRRVQESDVFQWLPESHGAGSSADWVNATVLARLRPGLSMGEASASLMEGRASGQNAVVIALHDYLIGASVGTTLKALWGLTALIVLAACMNVATLLLASIVRRHEEFAVKAAMGASRARLCRQILAEAIILVAIGVALALVFAMVARDSVVAMVPPVRGAELIAVNWRVVAMTCGVAATVCVLTSLLPAWSVSQLRPVAALAGRSDLTGPRRVIGPRLLSVLLATEIATATIAIVITALIVTSFWRLINVDPGFDPVNVVTIDVATLRGGAVQGRENQAIEQAALDVIRADPDVVAAGATDQLPMGGSTARYSVAVEGRETGRQEDLVYYRRVSPGYIEAMGIQVRRGRTFSQGDHAGAAPAVLINERMAREYFGGVDPIGRRLSLSGHAAATVVGVVADVRAFGLDRETVPEVYGCRLQVPLGGARFVVRLRQHPLNAITRLGASDSALPKLVQVRTVRTLDEWVSRSILEPRFRAMLCGTFAALLMVLVTLGVVAITVQTLAHRRRELGVRLAIGGSAGRLQRQMLARGLTPVMSGLAVGLVSSQWLTSLIERFLFGVPLTDPLSIGSAIVLVVATAFLAMYVVTLRIARIDPSEILRCG